jgi:hypothetical protein
MKNEIKIFKPYIKKVHSLIDSRERIKIVFVGIDRYPKDFSGIPFCKKEWEQFNKKTAGTVILNALGLYPKESIYPFPEEYFIKVLLKQYKIAFINLSYKFLKGKIKVSNLEELKKYFKDYNQNIICNSEIVVLCGKKVQDYFYQLIGNNEKPIVICNFYHPSAKFRPIYKKIKEKFDKEWDGKLLKDLIK